MTKIVTILLTHQTHAEVCRMLSYWQEMDAEQEFIIAHGGDLDRPDSFDGYWVKITDPMLRTKDHPRERQSYLGVFQALAPLIAQLEATHVHLAEYDEIPLIRDLNQKLLDWMSQERCDVLGHRLVRVDQSSHPHYLDHQKDSAFDRYWQSIGVRDDATITLSMLGCGSFWKHEAFQAVASLQPSMRMYLELFLPTAAHHLGYRVRPMPSQQDVFMAPEKPKSPGELERYRELGAWRLHPVKHMWLE